MTSAYVASSSSVQMISYTITRVRFFRRLGETWPQVVDFSGGRAWLQSRVVVAQ